MNPYDAYRTERWDSPGAIAGPLISLHSPEFAADPHRAYHIMRQSYGSLVPVELAPGIPATLVIGYRMAVEIMHDERHFSADPRAWQQSVPSNCPVLPVLEWRPNAIRSAGAEHARYRRANAAAIDGLDLNQLDSIVRRIATSLINAFCTTGTAELITQYTFPLMFQVMNAVLGCPPEIGYQISAATAAIFDGVDAEEGNRLLGEAIGVLVALKRSHPGQDITTRLLTHPANLDDEELVHQLVVLYGSGIEPMLNLITNTVRLILTDDRFGCSVLDGSLSTRDALDEVLYSDPPIANFSVTYPLHPIMIDGVWLPAHQPVVISMSACNNDPAVNAGERVGNRAHLAWGAGPHVCPAQSVAYLIAEVAIDQLLDVLPDIQLAEPAAALTWRQGPFHRALTSLPVIFPRTSQWAPVSG